MKTNLNEALLQSFNNDVRLPESLLPENIAKKIQNGDFNQKKASPINLKKIVPFAAAAVFCVSIGLYAVFGTGMSKASNEAAPEATMPDAYVSSIYDSAGNDVDEDKRFAPEVGGACIDKPDSTMQDDVSGYMCGSPAYDEDDEDESSAQNEEDESDFDKIERIIHDALESIRSSVDD